MMKGWYRLVLLLVVGGILISVTAVLRAQSLADLGPRNPKAEQLYGLALGSGQGGSGGGSCSMGKDGGSSCSMDKEGSCSMGEEGGDGCSMNQGAGTKGKQAATGKDAKASGATPQAASSDGKDGSCSMKDGECSKGTKDGCVMGSGNCTEEKTTQKTAPKANAPQPAGKAASAKS